MINFGLIYGMSAFGLARQLGIERCGRAAVHGPLFRALSRRRANTCSARARRRARSGYVETVFGRRLWLPEIRSGSRRAPAGRRARRDQRADAGHRGRPDQDGDDRACRTGSTRERLQTKLIMQVHDELVLEVPDAEIERVKRAAGAHGGVARARGAAGGGSRRRAELGQGALSY